MTIDHAKLASIYWHPQQLNRIETSLPPAVFGRIVGRMARALVFEQIAAEQWRAKEAFTA